MASLCMISSISAATDMKISLPTPLGNEKSKKYITPKVFLLQHG